MANSRTRSRSSTRTKRKQAPSSAASRAKKPRAAAAKRAEADQEAAVVVEAPTRACAAMTFGSGDMSQLGHGREPHLMERKKPMPVKALAEVRAVAAASGALHNAVLDAEGRVWTWGCNDDHALGRETREGKDGYRDEIEPVVVGGELEGARVAQVACGDNHTLAVTEDGRLFCWGTYKDGQGTLGFSEEARHQPFPRELPELRGLKIVQAAAGENQDLALTASGQVYEWGDVRFGQRQSDRVKTTKLKPRPVRITAVPAGGGRRRPVKVRAVYAAGFTSFAVAEDGSVYAWGLNNYGQAGTGDKESLLKPTVVEPLAGLDLVKIAGGTNHTLFLTRDGRVLSCGNAEYGRLGHGNNSPVNAPTEVAALSALRPGDRVVDVAGGGSHSIAVTENGHCYLWGFGETLNLGNAEERDENAPHLLTGKKLTTRVVAADGGCQHSLILAALDGGAPPAAVEPKAAEAEAEAEPALPDEPFSDDDGAALPDEPF